MTDFPGAYLRPDGDWGPFTVYAFQYFARQYGWYGSAYNLDGIKGHQTRCAIQRWLSYGENAYTGAIDGWVVEQTVDAMRRVLDSYVNFAVEDSSGNSVGSATLPKVSYFPTSSYVRKLQVFLNLWVDGAIY